MQEKMSKSNLHSYEEDIAELNTEIRNNKNQIELLKRKKEEEEKKRN